VVVSGRRQRLYGKIYGNRQRANWGRRIGGLPMMRWTDQSHHRPADRRFRSSHEWSGRPRLTCDGTTESCAQYTSSSRYAGGWIGKRGDTVVRGQFVHHDTTAGRKFGTDGGHPQHARSQPQFQVLNIRWRRASAHVGGRCTTGSRKWVIRQFSNRIWPAHVLKAWLPTRGEPAENKRTL